MDDTDAELVAFLHDLPDGAADAIGRLMKAAAAAGAKKSSKQAWIRLAIQSVIVGFVVVGGLVRLGDVATKGDIKSLEKQYGAVLDARSSQDETQNNRLASAENICRDAMSCCVHQGDRLDQILTPRSR